MKIKNDNNSKDISFINIKESNTVETDNNKNNFSKLKFINNYDDIKNNYPFLPLNEFDLKEVLNGSKTFENIKRCDNHKVAFCDYFCLDCNISVCKYCCTINKTNNNIRQKEDSLKEELNKYNEYTGKHHKHYYVFKRTFLLDNNNLDILNNYFIKKSSLDLNKLGDNKKNEYEYDLKEEIINSKNKCISNIITNFDKLIKLLYQLKDKKIEEIENVFLKHKEFHNKIINKIDSCKTNLDKFIELNKQISIYPKVFSDVMFLQGFDVINSCLSVVYKNSNYFDNMNNLLDNIILESNNLFPNLIKVVSNSLKDDNDNINDNYYLNEVKDNFETSPLNLQKYNMSKCFINSNYKKEYNTLFESINNSYNSKIKELNDKVEKNIIFNEAYFNKLNENISNDDINYLFSNQFAFLNVNGPPRKSVFKYNKNIDISNLTERPKSIIERTSIISPNSYLNIKKGFSGRKSIITYDNENANNTLDINYYKNYNNKYNRKSIDYSLVYCNAGNYDTNNKKRNSILDKNENSNRKEYYQTKVDLKLFNLAYINYINTNTLKWDNFINFCNYYNKGNNKHILENKLLSYASKNTENRINKKFLLLLDQYINNQTYEKMFNNGRITKNKSKSRKNSANKSFSSDINKYKIDINTIDNNMSVVSSLNYDEVDEDKFVKIYDGSCMVYIFTNSKLQKINLDFEELLSDYIKETNTSIKFDKLGDLNVTNCINSNMSINADALLSSPLKTNILKVDKTMSSNSSLFIKNNNTFNKYSMPYNVFPLGVRHIIVRNKIYFIGGKDLNNEYNIIFSYSFKSKQIKFEANMIYPRSYCTLLHDNDNIYIIGGEMSRRCEFFNILDKSCHKIPNLNSNRANGYLYLYKNSILYLFSGFKSEIFKNENNVTIERLVLREQNNINNLSKLKSKSISSKEGQSTLKSFSNFKDKSFIWEKIEYNNLTGIDVLVETYGLLPITDNFVMLYGGYSNRLTQRLLLVFDLTKHELHVMSSYIIKELQKAFKESKELMTLLDEYIKQKVYV